MAPLPKGFSLQAIPVRAAMSEGRTRDATDLVCEILRSGRADKVIQGIAADLLKPAKKARGRRKSLPRHWLEIGEAFHTLRDDGVGYEKSIETVAVKFGYSTTHIRTAITTFDHARDEAATASRT